MTLALILDDHVAAVCKPGAGHGTCRYLTMGPDGWGCAKRDQLAELLDGRVAAGTLTAQGDNCSGAPDFTPNEPVVT